MRKTTAAIILLSCLALMVSCDDNQEERVQQMCMSSFIPYSGYLTMLINGDFFIEGENQDYVDDDNILDTYILETTYDGSYNITSLNLSCLLSNQNIRVNIICHDIEYLDYDDLYGFMKHFKGVLDMKTLDSGGKTISDFSFDMKVALVPKTPMLPPRYSYDFEFHKAYAQGESWKTDLVASYINELANSIL